MDLHAAAPRCVPRLRGARPAIACGPECAELDAASAAEVLAYAAQRMAGGLVRVADDFHRRLQARHARCSTALGRGVALPHAESGYANRLHALFVRTARPLAFDAPDGAGVSDFLLRVVPRPASPAHCELLERLGTQLASPLRLRELRSGPLAGALARLWQQARGL